MSPDTRMSVAAVDAAARTATVLTIVYTLNKPFFSYVWERGEANETSARWLGRGAGWPRACGRLTWTTPITPRIWAPATTKQHIAKIQSEKLGTEEPTIVGEATVRTAAVIPAACDR